MQSGQKSLSETVSGKTHDMKIAKDTDFMSAIPKEILCLLDTGFEGIDKIYPKAKISKPVKKKKNKELTKTQKTSDVMRNLLIPEIAFSTRTLLRLTLLFLVF